MLAVVAALLAPDDHRVAEQLAEDPTATLARLCGFVTAADLDATALQLYDAEE